MTTSLVISYPDIPFRCANIGASYSTSDTEPNYTTDFHFINTVSGNRSTYWYTTNSSDTHTIYYYFTSGTTAQPDHVIAARADLLPSNFTLNVQSSTDAVSWTTETSSATLSGETFYGAFIVNSTVTTDYIKEFTTSNNRRYWRIRFSKASGSNAELAVSKLYLGNFFDFNAEPDDYNIERIPAREVIFRSDSGTEKKQSTGETYYRITLDWWGVTDDKVKDFYNKIVKYAAINPVFLYTRSVHELLDSQRLLHCRLTGCRTEQIQQKVDFNRVSCTFDQVLG
jgi:hypothetical protein